LVAPVVEAFFDAFFHALVPGTIVDFPLGKVGLGDVGTLEVVGVEINPLPSGLAQRLFQEPPAKSKFLAVDVRDLPWRSEEWRRTLIGLTDVKIVSAAEPLLWRTPVG
jgi:hypothetical protein